MRETPPARPGLVGRLMLRVARGLAAAASPLPPAPPERKSLTGSLGSTGVQFTGPAMINNRLSWFGDGTQAQEQADRLDRATAFVTSAYCYVAMLWRARRVAEPPLMVVLEGPDGEEWQPDHPLAALLEQPRPDIDMGEFLLRSQLYRDATGACLWVTDRNVAGLPAMVTPFAKPEFRTRPVPPLIYGRYEIATDGGTWRPLSVLQHVDLVHFRDVNPADWHTPVSLLDVALLQLNLGHTVNRIVRNFIDKAMFPGGIISPDPEWHPQPEEWDLWKETIDAWNSGPANAGTPLALQGGTTFSRVASELSALVPGDVLDRVEATVGSVFGTPPVVLGWLTGLQNSPWSQMTDARTMTYEDTIEPIWRDVERRIGRAWLSAEERSRGLLIRFDTAKVKAIQEDAERRSRISSLNADIWTVNQRLMYTGQDPLPDDDPRGDVIVGLQAPAPPPDAVGAGADATAAGKAIAAADLTWLLFDLEAKAGEGSWERAIYAQLQAQRATIVALARTHLADAGKAEAEAKGADSFHHHLDDALAAARAELTATTYPLLLAQGGKAVRRLSARIGLSFRVLEPGLLKYAREEADFLGHVMGETTGRAVAAAVQAGLDAGETVAGLVKRLEDLPEFDRGRARLTARTETTRAWNGAQRRSMSDYKRTSGQGVTKTWLTARDDRVRDSHKDLEGETVPVDAAFSDGQQAPGEPNCRCTLTYTVTDPATDDTTDIEETQ